MQHNPTKVGLSKDELELVTNAQILLTKNEIIRKVYSLFGMLANEYIVIAEGMLPAEVKIISPKVSRGENYEGLPYVMLDYPRYFTKRDTLAIRTFFWWGNFISITLQLSGKYQNYYLQKLQYTVQSEIFKGWYINIEDNEWDHHFRNTNYKLLENLKDLESKKVTKLSTKIPLEKWDEVQNFILKNFSILIETLAANPVK